MILGPRFFGGDHSSVNIHLPKCRVSTKEKVWSSVVSNMRRECFFTSSVLVNENLPAIPNVNKMFKVSGTSFVSAFESTSFFRGISLKVILISLPRASPDRENCGLDQGIRGCLLDGFWSKRTFLKMCWVAMWLRNVAALYSSGPSGILSRHELQFGIR